MKPMPEIGSQSLTIYLYESSLRFIISRVISRFSVQTDFRFPVSIGMAGDISLVC